MKLTQNWLKEKSACSEGKRWFGNQTETDSTEVLKKLMLERHFDWANWLIVRLMNRPQYLTYAIFSAREVLYIFEKKYPKNKNPRLAIEAAEKCLAEDSEANRRAAYAAAHAAYAAADTAVAATYAADTAVAAAHAAYAAANTAVAAAYAAAYAAATAVAAADGAAHAAYAAAYAAKEKMQIKILEYGITLLTKATTLPVPG